MKASLPLALTVMALASPLPLAAQQPGLELELLPKLGAYVPASNLTEAREELGNVAAELGGSLAVGLALELSLGASPVSVRGGFDYATSSELRLRNGVDLGEGADASLLALSGDLVLRPLPRIILIQPFLMGGAGIKRYNFEVRDVTGDAFPDEETDFTFHVGAGLDLNLGLFSLTAEVSDYISSFEPADGSGDSKLQNDIFAMVGFRVGMF